VANSISSVKHARLRVALSAHSPRQARRLPCLRAIRYNRSRKAIPDGIATDPPNIAGTTVGNKARKILSVQTYIENYCCPVKIKNQHIRNINI